MGPIWQLNADMVVRAQAFVVLALHVVGGLAPPSGEAGAGLTPFSRRSHAVLTFDRRPGSGQEDETVEKDENGIIVCPLKVDSCLAARDAQIECAKTTVQAKKDFDDAKKHEEKAVEAMAEADAMSNGTAKGDAKIHAGKEMTYWGKEMSRLGNLLGDESFNCGKENRLANEEATNERKSGNKEIRNENAEERELKHECRVADGKWDDAQDKCVGANSLEVLPSPSE